MPLERPRRRVAAFLLRSAAGLICLYLLLLIPERQPTIPAGAGREPFAWNQNLFWSELEQLFVQKRNAGYRALTNPIAAAFSRLDLELRRLAAPNAVPRQISFAPLETNLFRLAPMLAACPERLPEFISLANRIRRETKIQSEHWDLNAPSARHQLYRLLYGSRMALEEIMLQSPPRAVPQLIMCDDEPSRTPATTIPNVNTGFWPTIHSGDILVSRGGAPTSALIARGSDFPGSFSHVALVHVDERTGTPSVIEAHIERGVAVASFEQYLQDKKLRVMLLRLRADLPAMKADPMLPHKAAAKALAEAQARHIPYDFAMDSRDHSAQFCSEVVSAAYESVGIKLWTGLTFMSSPTVTAWLASLGVRHFETEGPPDLEYDPQLRVIAEWRDHSTLFKAHVDDAVTDVMLQEAPPGKPLPYPRLLLPLARISKAYSAVLVALGKVGPVPEGMSAATALRVSRYRRDHAAIAARVLVLANDFKRRQGYTPPYWELVRLARQARREVLVGK